MSDFLLELAWRAPIILVTSVLSFFVYALMTDFWHRHLRRRLQKQFEEYGKQHHNERECALLLSVIHDIREVALAYLEKIDRRGMLVFQVHQPEGFDDRQEVWFAFLERVKQEVQRIRANGAGRIYLFVNVPLALAVMTGATLCNGPEVVVHQYDSHGGYYPVGRLTVATVRL